MKNLRAVVFLFLLLAGIPARSWVKQSGNQSFLDINSLIFTSRAQCAIDSKQPTKSIFVFVDSLNTGKSLFRLGRIINGHDSFATEGVRRFRYTVFTLIQIISDRILRGELPLLNSNVQGFDDALSRCDQKTGCKELNQLIKDIWERKKNAPVLFEDQKQAYSACYSIHSFSPLNSLLTAARPDLESLNKIAQTIHRRSDYLTPCYESLSNEDLRVGLYQIDLREISDQEWNKKGFYFWNSLKIYLSWAFRSSNEVSETSGAYLNILKSVDLEESVLLFSNGCKSIQAPDCGRDYLNLSSLRSLTLSQDERSLSKIDFFESVPSGSLSELDIQGNSQDKIDILEQEEIRDAAEWATNFRENLAKTRGFFKLKLIKSLSFISIVYQNLSAQLLPLIRQDALGGLGSESQDGDLQELYLLCSEYKVALTEKTSFLRNDLMKIKETKIFQDASLLISKDFMQEVDWLLSEFGPNLLSLCDELDQKNIWKNTERPSHKLFAPWYQEYVFNQSPLGDFSFFISPFNKDAPLLKIKKPKNPYDPENIICSTPAQCGRLLLAALIDLNAFSEYGSGFMSFKESIESSNLLNPMAEKMVCKTYDPWFKTKKTIAEFLSDLFSTGLMALAPSPIFLDISIKEKNVISFEELMRDGKVFYDPQFDKKRIRASLIADFGPLLGAPCALSLSNASVSEPFDYLALQGFTVKSCHQTENNSLTVSHPSQIEAQASQRSGCISCTMNITRVGTQVASYHPGVKPFIFLIKGILRLISNLRDSQNFPRSWEVNPNQIYRSWRKNGTIPKSCKSRLLKGKECMSDSCEANIISSFEDHFHQYVSSSSIIRGGITTLSVQGDEKLYGLYVPRFGCHSRHIKKDDFFVIRDFE